MLFYLIEFSGKATQVEKGVLKIIVKSLKQGEGNDFDYFLIISNSGNIIFQQ